MLLTFVGEAATIGALGGLVGIVLGLGVVAAIDARSAAGGNLQLFAISPLRRARRVRVRRRAQRRRRLRPRAERRAPAADRGAAPLMAASARIVDVRDVVKVHAPGTPTEVRALDGVTFGVRAGEYVAIVGESGSGKTTLMHVLGGLDRPTSGDVVIDGRSLARTSRRELAAIRARAIGFVFQGFNLLPNMDARENVALAARYAGASRRSGRARGTRAARRRPRRPHAPPARRRSPAASSSASRSRARSSTSPRCCSPTSRPANSTRAPPRTCSSCSPRSTRAVRR